MVGDKKKKEEQKRTIKNSLIIRSSIFIGFLIVIFLSLPFGNLQRTTNYEVLQPWRDNDLVAPFTFSLNKTLEEIQDEEYEIRANTLPIYVIRRGANITINNRIDTVALRIQPVLDAYTEWQDSKELSDAASFNDSLRFATELSRTSVQLSDDSWQVLLDSYYDVYSNDLGDNRLVFNALRQRLNIIINNLLNDGIINLNKSKLSSSEITVRDLRESTERTLNVDNVRDRNEAIEFAQFRLSRFFNESNTQLGVELFSTVIAPNYIFSEANTEAKIQEAITNISKKKGAITQGQVIIRRGDIVTEETINILNSLAEARSLNATDLERWLRYVGIALAVTMICVMFYLYLFLYRRPIVEDNSKFLLVFLLLSLVIIVMSSIIDVQGINEYIMPLAIAPIILTIIFDSRVGIVSATTLSIIAAVIAGNNFEFTVAAIAACSLGVFSVRDIKNRSQFFFTTPGIVFITYVIVIGGFSLSRYSSIDEFGFNIMMAGISSLFILFTYPFILLIEKTFRVTTDFTLLELSDTNRPVLKDLMMKAPGTFHHSLQVANLAEAAAAAINANSLLCRVGSLYHDIGKMDKPEYFVENQGDTNEHEKIKPQISALVIKAHVTEGIKIAEENNIPDQIIDFIRTHHGTSVIRYFYEKAKDDPELKSEIMKEDFRYEGPLPSTKETGIVLIADTIEAASRAMKDPTYNKLKNLIGKLVDDKVSEGQLSHCPLTFRDLQLIKQAFLTILAGVYHSRIEYPEDETAKLAENATQQEAQKK